MWQRGVGVMRWYNKDYKLGRGSSLVCSAVQCALLVLAFPVTHEALHLAADYLAYLLIRNLVLGTSIRRPLDYLLYPRTWCRSPFSIESLTRSGVRLHESRSTCYTCYLVPTLCNLCSFARHKQLSWAEIPSYALGEQPTSRLEK